MKIPYIFGFVCDATVICTESFHYMNCLPVCLPVTYAIDLPSEFVYNVLNVFPSQKSLYRAFYL